MKKYIRIFTLIICAMISCFAFCACNDDTEEIISVNMIELVSSGLIDNTVSLVVGESECSEQVINFTYAPKDATQNELEVFGYDDKIIEVNVSNENKTITIKAKDISTDYRQTYVGIRFKDNAKIEKSIKVEVRKTTQTLSVPTNLRYDLENDMIVWDSENDASDGLNGYILEINGTQIACPINSYYKDFDRSVVNTVRVKANGMIDEIDSNFSQTYKFRIIENVSEFEHKDGILTWSKVSTCEGYVIEVDGHQTNVDKDKTELSIIDKFKNPDEYIITINTVAPQGTSGIKYFNSQKKELRVKKLFAPSNFKFSNNVLEWSSPDVKYIPQGYIVCDKDDNQITKTNEISYVVPTEVYSSGDYYFKVKALGDGVNTLDSDFTIYKSFTKLDKPTGVKIENGKLVWNFDTNTNGYIINFIGKVDGKTDGSRTMPRELVESLVQDGKVIYELGDNFKGEYYVSIINMGDGIRTSDSDASDSNQLDVDEHRVINKFYKFYAPNSEDFTMSNGKLEWTAVENCSSYEIIFSQAGADPEIIISQTNSCDVPATLISGNFNVKIRALGDNTQYVTSGFSGSRNGLVLSAPNLKVVNGELVWNKVANCSGYTLSINDEQVKSFGANETSFVLGSEYPAGNYIIRIKAEGLDQLDPSLGSITSSYCKDFQVVKLNAPTISIENGEFKCVMSNGTSFTRVNEFIENSIGHYNIYVYANGSANADAEDEERLLNSENSNVLNVWLLPLVEDIKIENGIVYWPSIAQFNEIAKTTAEQKGYDYIEYQGKFVVSYTYFDGNEYVLTEDGQRDHIIELGQNYSINFGGDEYGAGVYEIQVSFVEDSVGEGISFLNGTDYKLGKNLVTKRFKKLEKPNIEFIGVASSLMDLRSSNIPGTFRWNNVSGALNYEVKVGSTNDLSSISSENLGNSLSYTLREQPGKYYLAFQSKGNGSDVIDSGYTEVKDYVKLSPVTDVVIDNDNNKILWSSEYNNSKLIGLPTVIFVVRINGQYYSPYDYDFDDLMTALDNENFAILFEIEKVKEFQYTDELIPGENKIEILTYPTNFETFISSYLETDNPEEMIASLKKLFTLHTNDTPAESSSPLYINRLACPQGLRMNERTNPDEKHTLTWTPINAQNITGYQLLIKEVVKDNQEGLVKVITLEGSTNCSFNFSQFMSENNINSGSYEVQVRSLTTADNYLSSAFSETLTVNILTFNNDRMKIKNGALNWASANGVEKYIFDFKITPSDGSNVIEFTREYAKNITSLDLMETEDDPFVAGSYEIKVFVKGANDSYINAEYKSFVYLDTVAQTQFNYVKLDRPTNLRIVEGKIKFDKIKDESYLNNYRLYVQKVGTNGWDEIDLNKNTTYELDRNAQGKYYEAGNYIFKVRSDGGSIGLNSEVLLGLKEGIKIQKTSIYLENGILKWTGFENSKGYLVNISGTNFIVNGVDVNKQSQVQINVDDPYIDLSGLLESVNKDIIKLDGGKYTVKIKTLGTGTIEEAGTYLNSCYTDDITVVKLDTPNNVKIEDGRIVWSDVNAEVQIASGSGLSAFVKLKGQAKYTEHNIGYVNEFVLGSEYIPGTYSVYLQLKGNTNLKPSSNYDFVVNSSISNELVDVVKLPSVENLKVNYTTNEDSIGTLYFDKLDNTFTDVLYLVRLQVINLQTDTVNTFEFETSENTFVIPRNIEGQSKTIELDEGVLIKINVKALGKDKYFNSEFVPSNKELELTIPSSPKPEPNMIDNTFTGKVSWNKVDYATNYILKYLYIDSTVRDEDITEETWNNCVAQEIATTNNYAYVTKKGSYKFKVIAIITYVDGKRVEDISQIKPDDNKTEIKSIESKVNYTDKYSYSLFLEGDGEENPFIIDSINRFEYIKYNLSANYKLSDNLLNGELDFSGKTIIPFASKEIPFTGTLDGNNIVLKNITFDSVAEINALFNYIGKGGVVKNIVIENISIKFGQYAAAIAGYNLGTIDNCIIGATYNSQDDKYEYDGTSVLAPISQQSLVYCGGVVAYNQGLVVNCKNFAVIAPKGDDAVVYSGGIAAYNDKNGISNANSAIVKCINYGTVGGLDGIESNISSNYSGGITAYNQGVIDRCSNSGNVYATSKSSSVSIGAYAGGITAYNTRNSIITNCYNDNSHNMISNNQFVSITNIYIVNHYMLNNYIGGLVAYNEGNVSNCYTVSSIIYSFDRGVLYYGSVFGYCSDTSSNGVIYYISTNSSMDNGLIGYNIEDENYYKADNASQYISNMGIYFLNRKFSVYDLSNHDYILQNYEKLVNEKYVLINGSDIWISPSNNMLLEIKQGE